ncbi:unnamed protein product, partial [Porites lobata]
KHLFGGKSTKKEVFDKIAEQFTATSGQLQKEVEDHNNKSGKDRKSWKFYNELSQCLAKDKRCQKKPRSRSSAAEMLEFLKTYSEKREKAEEEKLRSLKEMNDQKTAFFDRFFQFMEKSKNN